MSGRSDSPELARLGGRLLGVGISGTTLTADERRVLSEVAPAAIVLFARNVESAGQLRSLIESLRQASERPPILMIDEEGGRVDRLRALAPGLPAAADLATCDDPQLSGRLGSVIGALLAEFDIEVNLAPVVDLWREGLSPSLVRRCFGSDAAAVSERAGEFIRAMEAKGVLSCLKHFPGLGVAETDPHHATSVVDLTMDQLEAADLAPYRRLGSMAPAVMVGHGIYPRIDPSGLPGTLSSFISTELLRDRLGYDGLAVTDDMEMHAVSDVATAGEIAAGSVMAGNDLVLFCSRIGEASEIAESLGRLTETEAGRVRFEEASERVDRFVMECRSRAAARLQARLGLEAVAAEIASLRSDLRLS